jgi:hypothetical protein
MKTYNTTKELREELTNCQSFHIIFECGLKYYHRKQDAFFSDLFIREHEYNFMFNKYTQDKFIKAVLGKIKRGGVIRELIIK